MILGSHECWQLKSSLIGMKAQMGARSGIIKDVIVSPNRNAYALKFEDGDHYDMTSYCNVEIVQP